jgi:XTP/dITP diphosphohydrolase
VVSARAPAGTELLSAVAVMDRLRSPGGCPWDAEQTHQSLVRYLVEETYELLEAIEDGDRAALREELGDVLLQVLFHARVAAEDPADPFTVDDVAAGLADKLISRHPHVFAGGDPAVRDAATQEHRWEQLKQVEKKRESSVDGVALGQPAVSLAAKLTQRATRAGVPSDLLPGNGNGSGAALFALAASVQLAGDDPEGELRAAGRRFAKDIRTAEGSARAAGVDPLGMAADDWRRFWPR